MSWKLAWLPLTLRLIAAQPAFDVASVKPVERIKTDTYNINLGKTNHGELTMGNVTLAECLKFAYGLSDDIQLAGPPWIRAKGEIIFDIVAKAPADTPREQLLFMLQTLLTERFQLVLHRGEKTASYLALVQSRKALKIEPADPNLSGAVSNTFHLGHIDSKGVYLPMLATVLSRFMRQPVLDMTGLSGRYVVKLDWTPDPVDPLKPGTEPGTGPTIYTAVQEQLGLKLESRKGPLEVIVVDHAERVPISN
jgi:uncharacterized protein (TIGR03435 family)